MVGLWLGLGVGLGPGVGMLVDGGGVGLYRQMPHSIGQNSGSLSLSFVQFSDRNTAHNPGSGYPLH